MGAVAPAAHFETGPRQATTTVEDPTIWDPMFVVELSPEAQADISDLKPFRRPPIYKALLELAHQAEVEKEQRKPLAAPSRTFPRHPGRSGSVIIASSMRSSLAGRLVGP